MLEGGVIHLRPINPLSMHVAFHYRLMLQYSPLEFVGINLGRGAMVAQRTLNPFILVRIRAPQPDNPLLRKAIVSDEFPTKYSELRPTW